MAERVALPIRRSSTVGFVLQFCKTSIPGSNPGGASNISRQILPSVPTRHYRAPVVVPKCSHVLGPSQGLWSVLKGFGAFRVEVPKSPPGYEAPERVHQSSMDCRFAGVTLTASHRPTRTLPEDIGAIYGSWPARMAV